MRKNIIWAVVMMFATTAFVGCTNEEVVSSINEFEVKASVGVSSRTELENDHKTVTWSTGDQIYLFGGGSEATMTLRSGAGEEIATFAGPVNGDIAELTTALYPVPVVDGDKYTFELTATREYSENSAAPMIGDYKNGHVSFQNLTALVRIDLTNQKYDDNSTLTFTMTGGNITGTGTVDLTNKTLGFDGDGNAVTIQGFGNATYVDFPIPTGTYTHYTLTLDGKNIIDKDIEVDKQTITEKDVVVISKIDYVVDGTTYIVNNFEGLLKWAYMANNVDNTLNLELEDDIEMPLYEIEEDAENQTYKLNEQKPITVTDGVPSGSNWIPVTMYESAGSFDKLFKGNVDGNKHQIKGLRIKNNGIAVGFIGFMEGGSSVKNIKFADAIICNENSKWSHDVYGDNSVGVAVGRSQNGTLIENVEVVNSTVKGHHNVGGIVGMNYRRAGNKYNEQLASVENCSTDANTKVIAYSTQAGGICGKSYGAAIIGCVNNADVEAGYAAGGIVGCAQEYLNNVNTYVIACGSTSEATVKAGGAGGLIGINTKDNGHTNGFNYIVACYSESKIQGENIGTMIGESRNSEITASWAVKNGISNYAGWYSVTLVASNHYSNASEITEEIVNEMNEAIKTYNETSGVEVTCPYTWSWTSGSWPVLK